MISDIVDSLNYNDFMKDLNDLLDYEIKINNKKINDIPLTEDEYIFDTYFVKPSTMIRLMLRRGKNDR